METASPSRTETPVVSITAPEANSIGYQSGRWSATSGDANNPTRSRSEATSTKSEYEDGDEDDISDRHYSSTTHASHLTQEERVSSFQEEVKFSLTIGSHTLLIYLSFISVSSVDAKSYRFTSRRKRAPA